MDRQQGKTILLVDDDPEFRRLVAPSLAARGYRVLEAGTAKEADDLLASASPDLLIVDGQLPDRDGEDFLRSLQRTARSLPVVFISAFWRDSESYRRLTEELGASLLMHKPVIPVVFCEQVASLLARHAARHGPEVDASAEEAISMLRRAYAEQLPGKLADLEQAVQLARGKPADQLLLAGVRTRAHKLRGTAGSYGFPEVGKAMGRIEDALAAVATGGAETGLEVFTTIEKELAQAISSTRQEADRKRAPGVAVTAASASALSRLLVVDDDEDFLRMVTVMSRQRLVDVVACQTPEEALEKAAAVPLDGALIDLQLGPGELSFDLVRRLRELPSCERLPLAFMSASVRPFDRVAAAHAGASLFLDKPLDPDILETAVQRLVALGQSAKPRILLVDDDEDFSRHVRAILGARGMLVHHLPDTVRVLDSLTEVNPDLLLLDVMMPGLSGFDVCRMLRTSPRWQELPVVFVTAHTGLEARIAAYECGGDDYLPKPVVNEELIARVEVRVERARLARERYEKDALTGLLARRPFIEQLSAMLAGGKRQGKPVTVGIIDMDRFKEINDTFGHLAGDAVLASFGKLLLRRFRTEDLRGRWGGEEFILAFRDSPVDTICGALQRVLAEFQALSFQGEDGRPFNVGFSCGLACFPADGDSIYDLTRAADRRLYLAKAAGRRQVVAGG